MSHSVIHTSSNCWIIHAFISRNFECRLFSCIFKWLGYLSPKRAKQFTVLWSLNWIAVWRMAPEVNRSSQQENIRPIQSHFSTGWLFHRKKCFFICTLSSAMTGNINMPFFMLIKHGCSQETSANPIFMHHWPLGPLAKTFSVLAWPKREYANVCVSVCMSRIQIKCPKLNWVHVREQRYLGFLNYSGMFKLGTFFSLSLHRMGWAALHLLKLYCYLAMQC